MANTDAFQKLNAARQVVTDPRLRTLSGKKRMLIEEGNVYGERKSEAEFRRFLEKVYADEATRKVILGLIHETALSVVELSRKTGIQPAIVFKHLLVLEQKGQVMIDRIEGDSPLYRSVG